MKVFRTIATAFALLCMGVFALSACQSTSVDAAIAKNLPKICDGAASAHAAFTIVAATGTIPAKVVTKENVAWAGLAVICKDPASVTSVTALTTAANAYAAIISALQAAKT